MPATALGDATLTTATAAAAGTPVTAAVLLQPPGHGNANLRRAAKVDVRDGQHLKQITVVCILVQAGRRRGRAENSRRRQRPVSRR
jgi:hypothetical protein